MTAFRFLALALLLALPAAAADSSPALAAATLRVRPNEGAKAVADVEKGDPLVLVQTTGLWSEVTTADGKRGWVPTRCVIATEIPSSSTELSASEASTAIAIRECPVRQAVVIGGRGLPREIAETVGAGLKSSGTVAVLETRYEAEDGPGSAVEKTPGSIAGKPLDVVIRLGSASGNALRWDVVAIKTRKVLAAGNTPASADPRAPADLVVATLLYHLERASHETHHTPH